MSIHPYFNPYTLDYDVAIVRVIEPFDGLYEAAVTLAPRRYEVDPKSRIYKYCIKGICSMSQKLKYQFLDGGQFQRELTPRLNR